MTKPFMLFWKKKQWIKLIISINIFLFFFSVYDCKLKLKMYLLIIIIFTMKEESKTVLILMVTIRPPHPAYFTRPTPYWIFCRSFFPLSDDLDPLFLPILLTSSVKIKFNTAIVTLESVWKALLAYTIVLCGKCTYTTFFFF